MPITKIIFLAPGPWLGLLNGDAKAYCSKLSSLHSMLNESHGFLAASVKWRPKGKFLVNKSSAPKLIGDSSSSYIVQGEPQLAEAIAKAADATGLWAEATDEWGLDPGHWHPLAFLRPEKDRPVVPLSLSQMSPEAHRKWGVAIRRGVQKWPQPLTLVVSGSLSFRSDIKDPNDSSFDKLKKFDDEILRMLTQGSIGELDLMDKNLFKAAQPEGGWGSLFFLWGALGEKIAGTLEYYERPLPGVASAMLQFSL